MAISIIIYMHTTVAAIYSRGINNSYVGGNFRACMLVLWQEPQSLTEVSFHNNIECEYLGLVNNGDIIKLGCLKISHALHIFVVCIII